MLRANPYILAAVFAVCDIFGLLGLIIYIIKHTVKGKRLKKIITAVICFAAADALLSFFIVSSNSVYDRNGNRYFNSEELKYYDTDGTAYTLETDDMERSYLVSEDRVQMFNTKRIYIDKDGYIFYDRQNKLKQISEYVFADENGQKYYSFFDVKWDRHGKIKLAE